MENKDRSPTAGDSSKTATETVNAGIGEAKAKASQTLEEAQRRGKDHLSAQKHNAAEQAEKFSDALDQASARLREEGQPSLAQYTEQIASSISGLAEKFRERSVDDLIRDTRDLARREPGLFLAGSVALGFAISRFFKASLTDRGSEQQITSSASEDFIEGPEVAYNPSPTYREAERRAGTGTVASSERPHPSEHFEKTDFGRKEYDHGR
ncbi:MAG TPA: hypothetical protein VHM64_11340 [Candidatus Binatia bacterium]|nr:hypothetical protein [Candidatus Binatia bacterium]